MSRSCTIPVALVAALATGSCSDDAFQHSSAAQDSASCGECHQEQLQLWQDSHHALAEQVLEPGAVIVQDVGPNGELQNYPALRSIGVDPLVQYIVDLDGRAHVPQQARDIHNDSWFDVFADGRQPGEWGHWTGRGMNWDTMCAVCHNTNLKRTWSANDDRFLTTMTEHGVGCVSCHDVGSGESGSRSAETLAANAESCWPCHARRSELGPPQRDDTFLDNYMPGLPDFTETWHVDGQIQDEDFEYTSFALSKMHTAGVTCLDCHDPHTLKLRQPGNSLCMSCHSGGGRVPAPIINTTTHSAHEPSSEASTCIACHMPTQIYMQRHARHDHGFMIPDPQLSVETGVPNACTKCHDDRSNEWAAAIVEARPTWTGNTATRRRARAMYAARQNQPDAVQKLIAATKAETQSTWRAALLGMLRDWPQHPEAQQLLIDAATSLDPLQRAMAWPLAELLSDPVRAVRLNAARALPVETVAQSPASADLQNSLRHNQGQPAGAMQEAQFLLLHGDAEQAIKLTKLAARWEPTSPAPLHLQASALDSIGRTTAALEIMQECCERFPEDATSWYLLGLAAAAEQDYVACKQALQTALKLQPDFPAAARNLQAIADFEKP